MLSAKKVPTTFWPEAVLWTFYVLNRCPTLAVKDVTPQEAWSRIKPSVDHFRIWGCLAHVHKPKVNRGKLDNRSFPCILLGVSEESKGYKLFDPNTKRVVVSKDVVFEEDKMWSLGDMYEEQISIELRWSDDDEVFEGPKSFEVSGNRVEGENNVESGDGAVGEREEGDGAVGEREEGGNSEIQISSEASSELRGEMYSRREGEKTS